MVVFSLSTAAVVFWIMYLKTAVPLFFLKSFQDFLVKNQHFDHPQFPSDHQQAGRKSLDEKRAWGLAWTNTIQPHPLKNVGFGIDSSLLGLEGSMSLSGIRRGLTFKWVIDWVIGYQGWPFFYSLKKVIRSREGWLKLIVEGWLAPRYRYRWFRFCTMTRGRRPWCVVVNNGNLITNSGVWVFMAEPSVFFHVLLCLGCFQMGLAPTVSRCFKEVAIHQKRRNLWRVERKTRVRWTPFVGCLEFQCLDRFRNRNSTSSSE